MADRFDASGLSLDELLDYAEQLTAFAPWRPLPHQEPPAEFPQQAGDGWLLLAGRGAGKTDACAAYFDEYLSRHPMYRGSIIGPTLGDVMESCIDGPSGLRAHNPRLRVTQMAGGLRVIWPNGSVAKCFGAHTPDDIERLRAGGNRHVAWLEELAAWRYLDEGFEHMEYGLRLGSLPHWIASTTPKNRALIKKLVRDETVRISHATTDDNPHLTESVRKRLFDRYGGTRMGRQELHGELLEDVPGALWNRDRIDKLRVPVPVQQGRVLPLAPVDLVRVVVAIDPAASATEESDETGIVAAGLGTDGHGYVLDDRTTRALPGAWARRALQLLDEVEGDLIVGEVNNGGDMVEHTVRTARANVAFRQVRASRGKIVRAEPVSALYEQGKVHHVGPFPELEDQMVSMVPGEPSTELDDRVDALVYALTELMIEPERQEYIVVVDPRQDFEISPV